MLQLPAPGRRGQFQVGSSAALPALLELQRIARLILRITGSFKRPSFYFSAVDF